eukprot:2828475-Rhodomonas_salina.3
MMGNLNAGRTASRKPEVPALAGSLRVNRSEWTLSVGMEKEGMDAGVRVGACRRELKEEPEDSKSLRLAGLPAG